MFKQFTVRLYVRFVLLLAVMVAAAWLIADGRWILVPAFLTVIAIVQVAELARFISRTNRELGKFVFSVRNNDFSSSYLHNDLGNGFKELSEAFQHVADKLRDNRIEKEAFLHFLHAIVEEIRIGLLAVNANNEVTIMNQTAIGLLDVPNLKKWERFQEKSPEFSASVEGLKEGQNALVTVQTRFGERQLAVGYTSIVLLGETNRIYTFYDLRNELERKELESYNKLISILTHEIMNSVTPVSSLAETVGHVLKNEDGSLRTVTELDSEDLKDVADSIDTIRSRSRGMLQFVQDYRKVAKVREPQLQETSVSELLARIDKLMQPEMAASNIDWTVSVDPEPLRIFLDTEQIEQVLLNLVINARHAVAERSTPAVSLTAYTRDGFKYIEVADNGIGIPDSIRDKIFVPFFTTKEGGSGIGLSLSQQIMQKHSGMVQVERNRPEGTRMLLRFRF